MPSPPRKQPRGQRDLSLPHEERRLEVGAPEHGLRLDAFLSRRLAWRSRASLQHTIAEGRVRVLPFKEPQGAEIGRLRPGLKLRAGQEVVVLLDAARLHPEAGPRLWQPDAVPVIFEDGNLLAVNKPPHLNLYPTRRHRAGSLLELIHEREREIRGESSYPPTPCHRLDRETTGLLLLARSRQTRAALQRQFEERTVVKVYLALVAGAPAEDEGTIELPLGRDLGSRVEIRQGVRADGQPARTAWRLRRRRSGRALLELRPATGRQHQLRAHLAAIGHPIVGDKLYLGGDRLFLRSLEGELTETDRRRLGLERQALHSWRLAFRHPLGGRQIELEAPLWPDMAALVEP